MKNALTGILVMKAMKSIETAVKEIEAVGENRKADTTHFINASHSMGKYNAYMDILVITNPITFKITAYLLKKLLDLSDFIN